MASLSGQDFKLLEQTRQRLAQLTSSLSNLQNHLLNSDPLPPWPSLHTQTLILSHTLSSLSSQLQTNAPFLASTAVYPLPSYPGREQEPLLNQLLRKKLEPGVEEWVEQGRKTGEAVTGSGRAEEWRELWVWAGMAGNEQARTHDWGGEGSEESEGEDQEEVGKKMPRVGKGEEQVEGANKGKSKPLSMGEVLGFLNRGEEPKRRELQLAISKRSYTLITLRTDERPSLVNPALVPMQQKRIHLLSVGGSTVIIVLKFLHQEIFRFFESSGQRCDYSVRPVVGLPQFLRYIALSQAHGRNSINHDADADTYLAVPTHEDDMGEDQASPELQLTISLQVGERRFTTTKATLIEGSPYFDAFFADHWRQRQQTDGSYFIDEDGDVFEHVLRYLRSHGTVFPLLFDQAKGHDYAMYTRITVQAGQFLIPKLEMWIREKRYLRAIQIQSVTQVFQGAENIDTTRYSDVKVDYYPTWTTKKVYVCPRGKHRDDPDSCGYKCRKAQGDMEAEYEDEEVVIVFEVQTKTIYKSGEV
ncbi:MAG: hypothetical protein Q9217_003518 [Psora testacea]